MKYTGIAASPGVGVAPMYRHEQEELAVRDTAVPARAVDAEVGRFQSALAASRADLLSIRDRISRELSETEAEIYDAHLLILDDPDLRVAVEKGIRKERRNAAWVFRAHMAGVAATLAGAGAEHLRERQADVLDVERRVLRHLLGTGPRAPLGPDRPCVLVAHDVSPSEVALLDRERAAHTLDPLGGCGVMHARGGAAGELRLPPRDQHLEGSAHQGEHAGIPAGAEHRPDADARHHGRAQVGGEAVMAAETLLAPTG